MLKKFILIILVLAAACTPNYDIPSAYQVSVVVKYPAEFSNGTVVEGVKVTVTDLLTGREYTEITDEYGVAVFELRGGNYNFLVSFSEEHNIEINGYVTQKTILFNGSASQQLIDKPHTQITLQPGYSITNEGFVIKELYVSGSRTPEGKNYKADLFVEIYNNSERTLYSDGLCFGTVFPTITTRPTPFVDGEGNLLPRIPCWGFIAIVPGSGELHPVLPGESIVFALTGINHRDDPYGNPNSIDLSNADWEFCVENNGYYPDSPSVPNILMQRITDGVKAMIFDVRGQPSILFRLPSENPEEIFSNPDNFMIEPGGRERVFMVPKEWIIDGVENARLDETVYKRLPADIDLSYIQHKGIGEKVSIRRKVEEVIYGRVVYRDTNNSSEDFLTNQEPHPGLISAN